MIIRVAGTTPLIAAAGSLPLADAADASAVSRCGIGHGDERDQRRVRDLAIILDLSNLNVARTVGTLCHSGLARPAFRRSDSRQLSYEALRVPVY